MMSTLVLCAFSLSIIVFQISCKKEAAAESPGSEVLKRPRKILYQKTDKEVFTANYDGSKKQKINFTFPSPQHGDDGIERAVLSPDGKTVFLMLNSGTSGNVRLYSCNIDGSDLKVILNEDEVYQGESFFGVY